MDNLLFSYADPSFPPLKRNLIRLIERATGQPELKRLYLENQRNPVPGETFFQAAVRRLQLKVEIDPAKLAAIPKSGPLVVVANHPFGVLDGIVISWLVEKVRSDFLVLTNAVLLRAPEVNPYLLPVDFSDTDKAMETNLDTRKRARRHLEQGGCIIVFPAGGVSTAPDRLGREGAIDAPWQPFTSQLIQRTRATVVPIFFAGQNSRMFQIASHIHPALRLSLIFKEVRDRIGTTMPLAIGDPIPYDRLADHADRTAIMSYLREVTYGLGAQFADLDARRKRRISVERLRRLKASLKARHGRGGAARG